MLSYMLGPGNVLVLQYKRYCDWYLKRQNLEELDRWHAIVAALQESKFALCPHLCERAPSLAEMVDISTEEYATQTIACKEENCSTIVNIADIERPIGQKSGFFSMRIERTLGHMGHLPDEYWQAQLSVHELQQHRWDSPVGKHWLSFPWTTKQGKIPIGCQQSCCVERKMSV